MSERSFDIIEVRAGVEADNDRHAALVRERMDREGVYLINLMASPGAGKTTVLCRIIDALSDRFSIGVMEADMDADVDARKVLGHGVKAVQLHTGTSCHMDAKMTMKGLDAFDNPLPDVVILENVGNLVCPAEFDVGSDMRLMILSVPEGDDKPLKYPLMFTVSDWLLVNKIDTAPVFDFDFTRLENNIRPLNPDMEIFPVSAKTGEGMDAFTEKLADRIAAVLAEKRGRTV
ncbi:MAG: hydrogenase nickel incorporation protein HypB [Oscillospiraceae bacterium]|nr:hydrogenase nickel incorporation protein HypB [Oscillospiraceae bacterium]